MSVAVSTCRYINPVYNKTAYSGVQRTSASSTNQLEYAGYLNAVSPQLFSLGELQALTGTGGAAIYRTPGDANGFAANNWHTRCIIIAETEDHNYKLGMCFARWGGYYDFYFYIMEWDISHSTTWVCNSGYEFDTPTSNPVAFYNATPNYVYVCALRSSNLTQGGIYYYLISDSSFRFSFQNAFDVFFNHATKVNQAPDPRPAPIPETDPYVTGGNTGPGGGTGDFTDQNDNIDIPSLPSISATDTGFITLFNPSVSELQSLANYMWANPLFDVTTWKKIFADPMDAILGLSIVPVAVPNAGSSAVTVGNISTGIMMNKAAAQYVSIDCGTLNVSEYWGAYLDYDPYTKAEIYLPFIGTHALAVDDIMEKSVHVVYHVDILSGACCAYVKCGTSVLYTFVGQCSCSIPITGNDWTNVVNGALTIAASIGSMVATGGASAPMAVGAIASTSVNNLKPNIEKSGSMGGMGGMLGIQKPYLILTRPRQAVPEYQNRFIGYPSFITRGLSEISGYTEIYNIHIENIPATEQELSEIESLLKGGVIL